METERLISLRKSQKMSQELMSGLIGVSCRTYASWESGKSEMRASDLKKISEILNVSTDYLLTRSDNIRNDEVYKLTSVFDSPACIPDSIEDIRIEINIPEKAVVRFSIPPTFPEESIEKLINQIIKETKN